MSMIDISNDELESLMAELEEQTAQLAAKTEPKAEVVIDTPANQCDARPPQLEQIAESADDTPFDVSELDALESELEATLTPTKADLINAKQTVELEAVFTKAEPVEIAETPQVLALEPISEVETPKMVEPIKFELKYKPDVIAFNRIMDVSDATLDQCMQDQAALVAYHSALHANAEAQLARVKHKFSIIEAGLYDSYRKHFLQRGEKATEKAIENAVRLNSQWSAAHLLLIEAQTYAETHKGFVVALRDRCTMLVQLGSDRRGEMRGQVRINHSIDPDLHTPKQTYVNLNNMASRAMELARSSMNRSS